MPEKLILIEVYDDPEANGPPVFVMQLPAVPRVGEHLAKAMGGYFEYWSVKKVWYRQDWDFPDGPWFVCLLAQLED